MNLNTGQRNRVNHKAALRRSICSAFDSFLMNPEIKTFIPHSIYNVSNKNSFLKFSEKNLKIKNSHRNGYT